jgi:predicted DsbA family dithiol-disulfide isomerase
MNEVQSPTTSSRTMLLLVTGALLLTFGWMLAGGSSLQAKTDPKAAPSDKAATINGQPISMSELEAKAGDNLGQLQRQYESKRFEILNTTLDQLVEDKMLDLEAQATGKTKDALLAENAKAPEISDAEVDAFYTQLQQQRPQGLPAKEAIAGQIKTHLAQQKADEARATYMKSLRAKYKVETFFEEPRIQVATEGHPTKGPATAPITIVEFSDFQCPFCSRVEPTLTQIEQKYGDKIRVVFRQFPLTSIHPMAQKAAEASLCANEQGKFWQMHDAMFSDQEKLEVPDLKAKAGKLGLDQAKFDQCLDSSKYAARITEDTKAGSQAGVTGTPAFFINGRSLSGAQPYEALAQIIDQELAKSASKGGKG